MPVSYKLITVFTSEDSYWNKKPLYEAVLNHIRGLKTAARCIVIRGIAGCYESGEVATQKLLELSYNMPLKIEVLIPEAEADFVLSAFEEMVTDGVVTMDDLNVCSFKSSKRLVPKQLKVKDVMTPSPKVAALDTPVNDVIQLLLDAPFKGVPVVDASRHVAGIITQNDLIQKANLPIRLGLLTRLEPDQRKMLFNSNAPQKVPEIMTHPVITIKEEQHLHEAVHLMIKHHLKRLPVIDDQGILVGMLSRVDIFNTITKHASKWASLEERNIEITNTTSLRDIMSREMHSVGPDTPVSEVIEMICSDEIQRVAVVDDQGCLLGLISDFDLLPLISGNPFSIWDLFVSKLTFSEAGRKDKELIEHVKARIAGEIMKKNIITIREDATVDEAIQLMTEKELKRLPVVDEKGVFKGMISRDSVLRTAIKQEMEAGENSIK
jgi:CBS-domain-containing membrane protein